MYLILSNQNARESGVKEALWIMQRWQLPSQVTKKMMLGYLKDGQRHKWRPVPGMTVRAGRKVPGAVREKVMKVPKIMKLRKT